jgi:FtsZ-binding cell division protein ZapB
MIEITKETINQLSQMTPEEVAEKYSPAEMTELTTELQRQNEELQRQNTELQRVVDDQQARIARGKAEVLKRYGPKPLLRMELAGEDEIQILLFIDGEMNLYPQTVSFCDSFDIAGLIAKLLQIPNERQIASEKLFGYREPVNTVPMALCDKQFYIKQTLDWLVNKVTPKPKKIKLLPWRTLRLHKDFYKEMII